jgi:iron(III) transport system ATP-binding protein
MLMSPEGAAALAASEAVPTGPAYLRVEAVRKQFGSTTVLDGIDLDIADGEFVALLGPSGCGKTTLLRILCGIEQPSAGRILLQGADITATSPAERGFGVVFQSYALFPNLSAADNVAYGLRGMSREHRSKRVREMLELVGLAGLARSYPAQMSGGQQQRIALARALAPSPRVVLLDEPLSALDAQVRAHLRTEIRDICQRLGVSTVMVTHDQDEALSMADRVVLMHKGRIEQAGTPTALYAAPRTAFVAGFVGRMNLWGGMALGPETVRVGDAPLDCLATTDFIVSPGQTVRVGIRPEQVQISPHDPAWDRLPERAPLPSNTVIATVRATSFHGPHFSARLHSEALDAEISVDLPTMAGAPLPVRAGERVRAHLPAVALTLLAAA